jgi:hypothetical protein
MYFSKDPYHATGDKGACNHDTLLPPLDAQLPPSIVRSLTCHSSSSPPASTCPPPPSPANRPLWPRPLPAIHPGQGGPATAHHRSPTTPDLLYTPDLLVDTTTLGSPNPNINFLHCHASTNPPPSVMAVPPSRLAPPLALPPGISTAVGLPIRHLYHLGGIRIPYHLQSNQCVGHALDLPCDPMRVRLSIVQNKYYEIYM